MSVENSFKSSNEESLKETLNKLFVILITATIQFYMYGGTEIEVQECLKLRYM